MLSYLKVENFAVVERVEFDFSASFNILTGETGTGKSILIDALGLFLTKKISPSAIRTGSNKLVVEALFVKGDEEFVLRREIARDKKKSVSFVNGNVVPFVQQKELAEGLLNIYGQHEHIFLLHTANQRMFLDEYAQNHSLLAELSQNYAHLKRCLGDLAQLQEKNSQVAQRLDLVRFQISEIEELDMQEGEDLILEQQLNIISSSEEILAKSDTLIQELYQNDDSVYNVVAENMKNISFLQELYPDLSTFKEEIERMNHIIPEFTSALALIKDKIDYDSNEVRSIEEKVRKLNHLKSKYKVDFNQLLMMLKKLKQEKESLLNMNFSIQEKEKEVKQYMAQYSDLNDKLRQNRMKKGEQLSRVIERELTKLEMKKARFIVKLEEVIPNLKNINEKGTDGVEFYFSPNPGQELGPIKDVASGGELSRLMLVLKSLIRNDKDSTYIFDEIDAGIGGKTAEFVGEKLRNIAFDNQVVCISHLPQIASFANKHFVISKEFIDNQTYSYAKELSVEDKVKEIARLMAGSAVNDDVLKAAENLLAKNNR